MKFAVSTVAFPRSSIERIIRIAEEYSFCIEFSSSLQYSENIKDVFLSSKIQKCLHNYFPPPKESFVINLSSSQAEIRKRSIEHCLQGLRLASEIKFPFYSAHSGFLIDPLPTQLGSVLRHEGGARVERAKELFFQSLDTVLEFAHKLNTKFLIENNVISKRNFLGRNNPLLCCTPEEIVEVFNAINDPMLGLLLDTGHLKVSANTIGFSLPAALKIISPFIQAFHHSDNSGEQDEHNPITEKYWLFQNIRLLPSANNDEIHILEVNDQNVQQILCQKKLLENYFGE